MKKKPDDHDGGFFVLSQRVSLMRLLWAINLAILLTLSLAPQRGAQAASLTVDTANSAIVDDGMCSLAEAIQNANDDAQTNLDCIAGAGADIITLAVPVSVDGLVLFPATNPIFFDSGDSGLPEITSDITITRNAITRTGIADYRFLVVQSTGSLTLENISIANGSVTGDCDIFSGGDHTGCGGALVSNNGAITLTDATFTNNRAVETVAGDTPKGGAILAIGGNLSISNSTFVSNTGDFGGAIAAFFSTISIADSAFTDNTAIVSGGAIYNSFFGDITISGSIFNGNQVTTPLQSWNGGGAIDNAGSSSELNVFNSTFTDNSVGTSGGGGAILNFNASMANIANSRFSANNAWQGGAILNRGSGAIINVFSSTITNNTAGLFGGGGISNGGTSDTGIANIHNSEILNNKAEGLGDGGGIETRGILNVENTVIANNTASWDGGGISVSSGTNQSVSIIGSVVSNNIAGSDGGGLNYTENPNIYPNSLVVTDSTFDNNEADNGGGLYANTVDVIVTGSTFSNNTATNIGTGGGGGIHMRSFITTGGSLEMTNSTISDNHANQSGGGILLTGSALTATIDSSTIAYNTANSTAGADGLHAIILPSDIVVADVIIAHNGERNCFDLTSPGITDGGNNISSDGTCGFGDTGGVGIGDNVDPLLNSLGDNGGATKTYSLQATSPAIDNGSSGCPAADQRGAGRTVNCDIGAYETATSGASLSMSVDELIVYEAGETVATISVTLDNSSPSAKPVNVQVPLKVTGNATGVGFDYTLSNQNALGTTQAGLVNNLIFNANAGELLTQTFTLTAVDDSLVEDDEVVYIAAGVVGYATFSESDSVSVTIVSDDNEPPIADAGGPYLVAVDSTIQLDGSGFDPNNDILSYAWTSTDPGSSFDNASIEDPFYTAGSEPEIFEVTLIVSDGRLNALQSAIVVVYDPSEGFVTGGGWINSPTGAYIAEPELTGKANFGFVSKYKKGTSVPTGNTEFQFHAGDLNFHSDSYEWLVVTGGDNARFKGSGTINGNMAPNNEFYKFMIWAKDLDPNGDDTFRIRIWYEDDVTGEEFDVYDNGFDQPIAAGNIVVHAK